MKRMHRTLLGATGLVSFVVPTLLLLPKFLECPSYGRVMLRRAFGTALAPGPSTQFKWFMGATEGMPNGQTFDDEVYQCDDCVKVERRSAVFASESDAQNFVSQQASFGKSVNAVSSRIAAEHRFVIQYFSTRRYSILSHCGRKVRLVESDSLPHALEFDRRIALDCSQSAD